MKNAQELRETIISILKSKNIPISKMLSELGYNVSLISDMKRYNLMLKSDKLCRMADYLDVSMDYLMGRTDKPEVNK